MQSVCALPGLPGGKWQIVTFVPFRPQGNAAHSGSVVVVLVLVVLLVLDEVDVLVLLEVVVVETPGGGTNP